MYLENVCQLHERIRILYTVSPEYTATLSTADGDKDVIEATGETIKEAIENLEKKVNVEGWSLDKVRKMR